MLVARAVTLGRSASMAATTVTPTRPNRIIILLCTVASSPRLIADDLASGSGSQGIPDSTDRPPLDETARRAPQAFPLTHTGTDCGSPDGGRASPDSGDSEGPH